MFSQLKTEKNYLDKGNIYLNTDSVTVIINRRSKLFLDATV